MTKIEQKIIKTVTSGGKNFQYVYSKIILKRVNITEQNKLWKRRPSSGPTKFSMRDWRHNLCEPHVVLVSTDNDLNAKKNIYIIHHATESSYLCLTNHDLVNTLTSLNCHHKPRNRLQPPGFPSHKSTGRSPWTDSASDKLSLKT